MEGADAVHQIDEQDQESGKSGHLVHLRSQDMSRRKNKHTESEQQVVQSEGPATAPDASDSPIRRRVITELGQRLQRLHAIDSELGGGCGDLRRMELRTAKADLLAEIEALEIAIKYARPD